MDKISRLNNVIDWIKKNTIKPEDLRVFIESVTKIIKENIADIEKVKNQYKNDYIEASNSLLKETKKVKTIADKSYRRTIELEQEILALDDKVENIEIPEIPEFDYEQIKKDILETIPDKDTKEIVNEINNLPQVPDYQIDASHIKNLPKTDVTYIGGGGGKGISKISKTGVTVTELAKTLNFTGTAISSATTDQDGNVTVSIASGGSPLNGNPTSVGYFNATGNDLSTNAGYFDYIDGEFYLKLIGENLTEVGALYTGINNGHTIQVYDNVFESIDTRYVIANPSTFSSGITANIGSWGTDGTRFLIKESTPNTGWGVPSTTLFTQTDDLNISNSDAETSLIGTGRGSLVIPANYLLEGRSIKVHIHGYHSSVGNCLLTIKVKLNGTVVATNAVASGNGNDDGFYLHAEITCRQTGEAGKVSVGGHYEETHNTGSTIGLVQIGETTIDTTIDQTLDVTWAWAVADHGNSITSQLTLVESSMPF